MTSLPPVRPVPPVRRATDHRDAAETTLLRLLERHPDALVVAIGGEETPQAVPLPATIPVGDHPRVEETGTLLHLVAPADRAVIAKLWVRARAHGAAAGQIRTATDPEHPSNLYLVDLRVTHGVMVGVFAEGESSQEDPLFGAGATRLPAPRLGRATKDGSAVITWVDPALAEMVGWPASELVGRRSLEFIHPDDRNAGIAQWMEMIETPGPGPRVRLRHLRRDGSWLWLEVTNHNRLHDQEGDVLSEMLDVSEEMAAVEALRAREQLLGQLTETVPVGLFHIDLHGTLLFANRRLHDLTGTTLGAGLPEVVAAILPEDRPRLEDAVCAARGGADTDVEVRLLTAGRGESHCAIRIRPLRDDFGAVTGLTGCVEDVTVDVQARTELEARASRDPLTGALNRAATLVRLQHVLDHERGGVAVMFVDLVRFKWVNDQLGHAAGDELLIQLSERLRSALRAGDVIGRPGGDEFVLVCRGVPTAEHAMSMAEALSSRVFSRPVFVRGQMIDVRASFGVAWTDTPGADAADLIAHADTAMYRAKRSGHNAPAMFSVSAS